MWMFSPLQFLCGNYDPSKRRVTQPLLECFWNVCDLRTSSGLTTRESFSLIIILSCLWLLLLMWGMYECLLLFMLKMFPSVLHSLPECSFSYNVSHCTGNQYKHWLQPQTSNLKCLVIKCKLRETSTETKFCQLRVASPPASQSNTDSRVSE